MLSEMLQSVTGMGGYTTLGMIIFFVTFIILSVKAFGLDKSHSKYMSSLPFDSSDSGIKKEEV